MNAQVRNLARLMILLSAVALPQAQAPGATTPRVGKFRVCPGSADCSTPVSCEQRSDTRSCRTAILGIPGLTVDDPSCEAAKAAQNATYQAEKQACEAAKRARDTECRAATSSSQLCGGLKREEIDRCAPIALRLDRLSTTTVGPSRLMVPAATREALKAHFSAELLNGVGFARRPGATADLPLADEMGRTGWIVAGSTVLGKPGVSSGGGQCFWIQVLAGVETATKWGSDGYCQAVQFQRDVWVATVNQKIRDVSNELKLACDEIGVARK